MLVRILSRSMAAIGVATALVACQNSAQRGSQSAVANHPETTTTTTGTTSPSPAVKTAWEHADGNWLLAVSRPQGQDRSKLVLIEPAGRQHRLITLEGRTRWKIAGWSRSGLRLLLTDATATPGHPVRMLYLDLASLRQRQFSLPAGALPVGLTEPHGLAVIAGITSSDGATTTLTRFDTYGAKQADLASGDVRYVSTPDGTALVVADNDRHAHDVAVVSNGGDVLRTLELPAGNTGCEPVKWWSSRDLLVSCTPAPDGKAQLWLVPFVGGTAHALTQVRNDKGPDYGDVDAWQTPSGIYLTALGACSGVIIAKEDAGGEAHQVFVPHQPDRNNILATQGNWLLVDSSSEADNSCSSHDTYVWFDPTRNATRPFVPLATAEAKAVSDWIFW